MATSFKPAQRTLQQLREREARQELERQLVLLAEVANTFASHLTSLDLSAETLAHGSVSVTGLRHVLAATWDLMTPSQGARA